MLESLRNKKILVVVAHPDDELLGLGASLNKLIEEYACEVRVVILGEGITSRSDERKPEAWRQELEEHHSNILEAKKCIGYQSIATYQFPDNRFDSVDLLDLIKTVEKEKEGFKPEVIFTHHAGDLNVDHQRTFQAVLTASRPMKEEHVIGLITFETPSGTEWQASNDPQTFSPNFHIAISETNLEAKIKGMECYQYERREYPHPRSPRALRILAEYRGLTVGRDMAEAFQIIRWIDG